MEIIIAGAGTVGGAIAEQLSGEGHNITIIDRNPDAISAISGSLDVICLEGNASVPSVLAEAGAAEADLLIAATESDEVNMVCGITGRKLGARHVIARVRDPQYRDNADFLGEALGLELLFNPELECALEISRVLRFPGATRVDAFSKGSLEIAEHRIKPGEKLDGLRIREIRRECNARILVSLVERDASALVPNGDFVIRAGDRLSLTGSAAEMKKFFTRAGAYEKPVKRVFLFGGNRIAVYLARILMLCGIAVYIIEKNAARCRELCNILPDAVILCDDAMHSTVLEEEGLCSSDAFVSLTEYDGDNIIAAAYAKTRGAAKAIARIDRTGFIDALPEFGIDGVFVPRDASVATVTAYVRALCNSQGNGSIEAMYYLAGGLAEALEFTVDQESSFTGIPLKDLHFRPDTLIAALIRGRECLVPEGSTVILPGDHAIIVSLAGKVQQLEDIFESL